MSSCQLLPLFWTVLTSGHIFECDEWCAWPCGAHFAEHNGVQTADMLTSCLNLTANQVKWRQLSWVAFFLLLFLRVTEYRWPLLHQPTGCVKSNFLIFINVCFSLFFLIYVSIIYTYSLTVSCVRPLCVSRFFLNRNCMHISSDGLLNVMWQEAVFAWFMVGTY